MPQIRSRSRLALVLLLVLHYGTPGEVLCEPFLPTWKLMNQEQKQHFTSGYLKGQSDAAHILDIAIEYLKTNPSAAISGLEELKKVYDLSDYSAVDIVRDVDAFYGLPENREKPLSRAVSAARHKRE